MIILNSSTNRNNSVLFNQTEKDKQNAKDMKKGSIYAGDLNMPQDIIGRKKAYANKKALRTILEQFTRDKRTDEGISKKEEHINNLRREADSILKERKDIEESKKELKATYAISDDSNEQKDLELINKAFKDGYSSLNDEEREHLRDTYGIKDIGDISILKKGLTGETEKFTDETFERLEEIMNSLTDYQSQAISLYARDDALSKKLYSIKYAIEAEDKNLNSYKIELLKSSPMVDAQKSAKDILDAAGQEIIGMLTEEAVENIEENQEEEKEKAEKQQEQIEEQQIQEDDESDASDDFEYVQDSLNEFEKIQHKIKSDINANLVLGEDIKGIKVDEEA